MVNELIIYKLKEGEYRFVKNKYPDLPQWIITLSELVKHSMDETIKEAKQGKEA